jgi:hypothetical protein
VIDVIAGIMLNVMTTSSVDAVQGVFDMVQRSVYDEPAIPEKDDAGLEIDDMVPPVPLIMLHAPVPAVAAFAASVTEVCPHVVALV